jgi:hypothetical protein
MRLQARSNVTPDRTTKPDFRRTDPTAEAMPSGKPSHVAE